MKEFIPNHNIHTVVDLGCGSGKLIEPIFNDVDNILYYGNDCYSKL